MKDGFIRTAAITPEIKVADVAYNLNECIRLTKEACEGGASIIVFPELVLTGYTCQDLFFQKELIDECGRAVADFARQTKDIEALIFIGVCMTLNDKLYNVAAVFNKGELIGLVPKRNLPNYSEFYEQRHFTSGNTSPILVDCFGFKDVPFGSNLMFKPNNTFMHENQAKDITVAAEICEDLWVADPPSTAHAKNGADIIVNLSAGNELVTKNNYRRSLVSSTSARLICAYVYACAGNGESTQDLVFGGHDLICENGTVLAESELFKTGVIYADIDVQRLLHDRRRMNTWETGTVDKIKYETVIKDPGVLAGDREFYIIRNYDTTLKDLEVKRKFSSRPFVPDAEDMRSKRCNQILTIQAMGLKKRLDTIGCKTALVGLSGGLDSTLALIVMAKAFDLAGIDRTGIISVTMPCFGTTDRTYNNACNLAKTMGTTLMEINIAESVKAHFRDIGQDEKTQDITYENSQARERTQVLMDLSNKMTGLVVGTGDMSELALGWATYNGDHMSMYGVNASVPKTLVRHLVAAYARDESVSKETAAILQDVLNTPVSPELLPPVDGVISQKTEDIVGPYELHDFFLYYMLRWGFTPAKIYRLACMAFEGIYDEATILKWEKIFYRRFFSQQFKRSCLPDGPKVGSVALSPRGDWRMPSDAVGKLWQKELENIG